jgi:cytochrome c-type biogenesis protein CcmH
MTRHHLVGARFAPALALCALIAAAPAVRAVDPTELRDPALQARYLALTHELRCMQCQNETLADSPVELAADLRHQVRDQLLAGKSDDEIRAWMVARYGDFILFRPRTLWLWLTPGLLLAAGALIFWRIVRARSALVGTDDAPLPADEPDVRG